MSGSRLLVLGSKRMEQKFGPIVDILRDKFDIECIIHTSPPHQKPTSARIHPRRIRELRKFAKYVSEIEPDFIISDEFNSMTMTAGKKAPVLLIVKGHIWNERVWARHADRSLLFRLDLWYRGRFMVDRCLEGAAAILPVAGYLADVTRNHISNDMVCTWPIVADPTYWDKSQGGELNLKHPCVGVLQHADSWGKTVELISILPAVARALPDVTFYWAGDGTYRDQILDAMSGSENFEYLGVLQYPDQVRQYISEIDIYALASGMDGLPNSLLEASLMEKPIISTKVGGTPEVIQDGRTGFLVEPGDAERWIELISELGGTSDGSGADIGKNARQLVSDRFSPEHVAEKLAEILGEVRSQK